jgi:lipoprotein-anchoring transpeptidase ErfK/SrfK
MMRKDKLSRREFLKYSALAFGGLALSGGKMRNVFAADNQSLFQQQVESPDFPINDQLGRVCVGEWGTRVPIKSEPFMDAPTVGSAWYDDVFEWKQEVVAKQIDRLRINQRWVETPNGYIYADDLQKVRHIPQVPLAELPENADGSRGMWVEITTPYKDIDLMKPKENYQWWIRDPNVIYPRVHYSQVFWAFDIRQHPTTGKTQYCLMQKVGAFADTYWVDADVCKYITPEEISPIHPGADNKQILVQMRGIGLQTLTCFEGNEEVFFTTVTTGGWDAESGKWITPLGRHTPWRKNISMHYSRDGRYFSGFDLPGVGWNFGIEPDGVYIHSTYWHNAFGIMKSNGCINCRPEDAKWIWRWVEPQIPYVEGDMTWSGFGVSTPVSVEVLA